jgi:multidrug efflux pump subunit AcrA (membrane-fusion protein)
MAAASLRFRKRLIRFLHLNGDFMNKNTILRITLPILLLLGAVGVYWLVTAQRAQAQAGFTVSGTIEAVSSTISTEIGGKVAEIMVSEGAEVKRGEILFLMDETLLKAQAEQANAGLITAQKASETALAAANTAQLNYEMTAAAARQESATIRAADWSTQNPEGFTLPGGSFTAAEQIEAAKNALNYALKDLDEAKRTSKDFWLTKITLILFKPKLSCLRQGLKRNPCGRYLRRPPPRGMTNCAKKRKTIMTRR